MNEQLTHEWLFAAADLNEFYGRNALAAAYKTALENYPPKKVNEFYATLGRLPQPPESMREFLND